MLQVLGAKVGAISRTRRIFNAFFTHMLYRETFCVAYPHARPCQHMINKSHRQKLLNTSLQHQQHQMIDFRAAHRAIKLPELPIPPLEKTLSSFLESIFPVVSRAEYCATETAVCQLRGDCGKELQAVLEDKAKCGNWLFTYMLNVGHLQSRKPLPIYSNTAILLPRQKFSNKEAYINYTVQLILAAVSFKLMIDCDRLPPETMGGANLDMSHYRHLFGTCRIPGHNQDTVFGLPPNPLARHIVVMHNNHMFIVLVLQECGKPHTEREIELQLHYVLNESPCPAIPVGILTTDHRDMWATIHDELQSAAECNRAAYRWIEESLFVVCLDGPAPDLRSPNLQTEAGHQLMHGGGERASGGNRWYDKTLQFVVGTGGENGLIRETSLIDDIPAGNLVDYINHEMEDRRRLLRMCEEVEFPKPERIDFKLTPSLKKQILGTCREFDNLVRIFNVYCYTFTDYGTHWIESKGFPPDSFIQMAIQLAYYRLHGTTVPQLEIVSTRKFMQGRTDVVQSVSPQCNIFCTTMCDSKASDDEKFCALKSAVITHAKFADKVLDGFGVEGHLLALKGAALEKNMEIPELFDNYGYLFTIARPRLTATQVPLSCNGMAVHGPRVCDGYGCCYNPRELTINFSITSFEGTSGTNARLLQTRLHTYLIEIQKLIVKCTQRSKKR